MPKVSVIIPNYNHARYLRKRIQSVLDQTFQDFDLTYLDDASSDESNAVFAEFDQHPRIKAIYNDENSGSPFKQWNKGIRATSGEYVWIAESDDVADPQLLATLVPLLDQNPNVGLAYCQSRFIDSNDSILQIMSMYTDEHDSERWNHDFIANGLDECQKSLLFKNTIPNASAVLIRRSIYEAIGGAEESLSLTGDWMTWIRMLLKSDIAFSAQPLNFFRCHSSSVRSRSVLNGTEYYERMIILQTLKNGIQVPAQAVTLLGRQLMNEWVNLALSRENDLNFHRNVRFYRLAKNTVSGVEGIILRKLISHMKYRCEGKIWRILSVLIAKLRPKLNN
jgi:glycosyltransferase involved in cell wall biosynthesis